jgi:hypothetical protein
VTVTARQSRSNRDGRSSPHDEEAERALIGSVLKGARLAEIRSFLGSGDFYDLGLAAAYREALKLEASGVAVDNITLAAALEALPAPAGEGSMLDRLSGRAGLAALTQECPTSRNAVHYARLVASAAATRGGRPVVMPSSPAVIERVGLGYRASFAAGVELKVDRLRESHGELSGELLVRWQSAGGPNDDGHISRARLNLVSIPARNSAAGFLEKRTRGAEIPWGEVLERFSVGVLDMHRAGDSFELVGQRLPEPEPGRILHPILPADAATLLYAKAGTGKSTLAAAIAVAIQTGREVVPGWRPLSAPVLVLDWEASAKEWNHRVAAIAAGIDITSPAIHYRRMDGALADRVEELAAFITERSVGLLIVDSVGMAIGTSRDGADANDSALRLFAALRAIGTTSLLVDHIAGAELDKSGAVSKAYGSVYKMNLARAAYELCRETDPSQGRAELVLRQAKVNDQGRLAPIGLVMVYESGPRIRFEQGQVEAPELVRTLTVADQMVRLLRSGAQPVAAIAGELGKTDGYVRSVLHKDFGKRFRRLEDGRIGLASHG